MLTDTSTEALLDLRIERVVGHEAAPVVERLLREYLPWLIERMSVDCGVRFDDALGLIERHHAAFAREMPHLLGGPGRLLLAHLDGQPAGLVALKPVDARVGEVKRLYVRNAARGRGVARALMQRLIDDARSEGFDTLRLETASFMAAAHALYGSLGFTDAVAFEHSEAQAAGVDRHTHTLQLALRRAA